MFRRIGRVVVRHPIWTIVAWLVAAVAIVATAPSLPSSSDESSFLPKSYESIQANDLQSKAFPQAFTPAAYVLFSRTDGGKLTAADTAEALKVTKELGTKHLDQVQLVVPGPPSKDGKYDMSLVQMDAKQAGQDSQGKAAKKLRDEAKQLVKGSDLQAQVGGSAAQNYDLSQSNTKGTAIVGLGVFVIILLTLLVIFRAPLIAIMPLVMVGVISMAANGLIADATKLFHMQANGSVSTILTVVLFGVGTDYFLFLIFRYRERLRMGEEPKEAMINAVGRVGEAIASAAGTVMIAFLALTLSALGFFQQMGPALAIAVAVTLIAALTLIPAVCSLIPPRALFWPSKKWMQEPSDARFAALGRGVQRRPGLVALVSGLIMVALAVGATGYKSTFDMTTSSLPKTSESMVVQNAIQSSYSAGAAEPTTVFVTSTDGRPLDKAALTPLEQKLQQVDGVSAVQFSQMSKDGKTADISVILKYSPESNAALSAVGHIRSTAHANAPNGTKAVVGGVSAIYADINKAIDHDYRTVFPFAAILIMLILGLMLRSLVAPWYLMASVALGFGATLGTTVLLLQHTSAASGGLMFMLPVIMYLFVVAIGTDYNILMVARLREEAREGREPREAASMALRHAGPTIAAAGFILAATFLSMVLAGQSFMTQVGFAVGFGIAVAAFVMAMFFTPSLTALIGHAAWWPGHADRGNGHGEEPAGLAAAPAAESDSADGTPDEDDGPRVAVFNRGQD